MSNKSIFNIIRRPIISEKSIALREALNQVTFEVDMGANKIEIRKAVEQLLEASVSSVNTLIVRGKSKRVGRYTGKRPNWKKAVVTLNEGESIEALDLMDQFDDFEQEGEE
ncbi:MAG: 50S ribosomal protein L23 [Myxococcales bacterium]|nr:50S ribosomal protein L23 [Myxococcales bacterium]